MVARQDRDARPQVREALCPGNVHGRQAHPAAGEVKSDRVDWVAMGTVAALQSRGERLEGDRASRHLTFL